MMNKGKGRIKGGVVAINQLCLKVAAFNFFLFFFVLFLCWYVFDNSLFIVLILLFVYYLATLNKDILFYSKEGILNK